MSLRSCRGRRQCLSWLPNRRGSIQCGGRLRLWTGIRRGPGGRDGSDREVVLDVVYDGDDLGDVAGAAGLTVEEVVEIHSGALYGCDFCGFAPGFAYLSGLDPRLHLPRRATPRTSVPAGSVAIAGPYTAAYPSASPGGWHLLGRTDATMWDLGADPPALITPGATVRFRPVDRSGHHSLRIPQGMVPRIGSGVAAGRHCGSRNDVAGSRAPGVRGPRCARFGGSGSSERRSRQQACRQPARRGRARDGRRAGAESSGSGRRRRLGDRRGAGADGRRNSRRQPSPGGAVGVRRRARWHRGRSGCSARGAGTACRSSARHRRKLANRSRSAPTRPVPSRRTRHHTLLQSKQPWSASALAPERTGSPRTPTTN